MNESVELKFVLCERIISEISSSTRARPPRGLYWYNMGICERELDWRQVSMKRSKRRVWKKCVDRGSRFVKVFERWANDSSRVSKAFWKEDGDFVGASSRSASWRKDVWRDAGGGC